jgi:hypothetical protein
MALSCRAPDHFSTLVCELKLVTSVSIRTENFRLYLHASSLNLLNRLRQETEKGITPEKVGLPDDVLEKTATPSQKKLYFNRRRRADPLGEGFACTWRTMFIKVACEVSVSARRVLIKLSSH